MMKNKTVKIKTECYFATPNQLVDIDTLLQYHRDALYLGLLKEQNQWSRLNPRVIKPLNLTIYRKHRRKRSMVENHVNETAKSPRLSETVKNSSPVSWTHKLQERKRDEWRPINKDLWDVTANSSVQLTKTLSIKKKNHLSRSKQLKF